MPELNYPTVYKLEPSTHQTNLRAMAYRRTGDFVDNEDFENGSDERRDFLLHPQEMVGSDPSLRHNPLRTNQEMVDSEPSLRMSDGNQYQEADAESGAGDASNGNRNCWEVGFPSHSMLVKSKRLSQFLSPINWLIKYI